MAIDEGLRLSIHSKLTELLGSEEATALIEHIMPVPWHDVATKDDLQNHGILLRSDIVELRAEMAEFKAEMRAEMAEFKAEMRAEIAGFRAEMRSEMAALRVELHQGLVAQTRWLMGYVTALSAIMLALARLLF